MDDLELTRIVEDLTVGTEEQHTLQEVVDQAVATVPGCDMCSVFVRRDRQLIDVGATTSRRRLRGSPPVRPGRSLTTTEELILSGYWREV